MTIDKLFRTGTLIATLDSKEHPGKLARIYAACESRGHQTKYLQKLFFFFVPMTATGLPMSCAGITKDARRKQIPQHSNVTILDKVLWNKFTS